MYPEDEPMTQGITERIIGFCAKYLKVDYEEAVRLRKEALCKYENTLSYLMSEGLTDIEQYFAFVHPSSEVTEVHKNETIRPLLQSIDLPKIILTNSPKEHAENVLEYLGIRDLFNPVICDVRMMNLKGKPHSVSYKTALDICGGTICDTLFLDDGPHFVKGFVKLGGTGVLVGKEKEPDVSGLPGNFYHIKDVYELPLLLKKLNG